MANDSVSVSGPIDIASDSKQAVAFELMKHIANWEEGNGAQMKTRDYWLTLYRQCYKAANGSALERILQAD